MLLHFAVGVIINIVGTVIVLRFVVNACITLNLWDEFTLEVPIGITA